MNFNNYSVQITAVMRMVKRKIVFAGQTMIAFCTMVLRLMETTTLMLLDTAIADMETNVN